MMDMDFPTSDILPNGQPPTMPSQAPSPAAKKKRIRPPADPIDEINVLYKCDRLLRRLTPPERERTVEHLYKKHRSIPPATPLPPKPAA